MWGTFEGKFLGEAGIPTQMVPFDVPLHCMNSSVSMTI